MQTLPSDPFAMRGTVDNGPGPMLGGIGQIFATPNPAQQLAAAQAARTAAAQGQLGQIFANTGSIDPNLERSYLSNGGDVDQLGKALRLQGAMNGGVDSDQAARAAVWIGAFNNTPLFQQRAEQAASARAIQQSQIAAQAAIRQASLEPVAIQTPDGKITWTTKGAIAAGNQPQGAQPLLSPDQVKGAIEARHILPDQGAPPMTDAQSGLVQPDASELQVKQVGTDALGNPQFGVFDPATGTIKPVTPPGAPQASAAGPAPSVADATGGLHGPAFLAQLPPQEQAIVKAVAEGRTLPPAMGRGPGMRLMALVTQYDLTFDASNSQLRFQTRKDFGTGGKSGQTQVLAGSALGHLGELLDILPQLGNTNAPGAGIVNPLKNAALPLIGGAVAQPLNQYKEALQRFAGELDKFYT